MNGVLVASDQTQEWILPWWWSKYCQYNQYPVVFVDLGLSFEMKDWCKQRGELRPLRMLDFVQEQEEIDLPLKSKWEEDFGVHFWESRGAWFKKPFACLQSPFQKTIWIDIDCEIRTSLAPLFEYSGFAIVRDQLPPLVPYQTYNSGVIVFERNCPYIQEWAAQSLIRNGTFRGDQELLSAIIAEKGYKITELPLIYNCSRCALTDDALIIHWHGIYGREVIKNQMAEKE